MDRTDFREFAEGFHRSRGLLTPNFNSLKDARCQEFLRKAVAIFDEAVGALLEMLAGRGSSVSSEKWQSAELILEGMRSFEYWPKGYQPVSRSAIDKLSEHRRVLSKLLTGSVTVTPAELRETVGFLEKLSNHFHVSEVKPPQEWVPAD